MPEPASPEQRLSALPASFCRSWTRAGKGRPIGIAPVTRRVAGRRREGDRLYCPTEGASGGQASQQAGDGPAFNLRHDPGLAW